MKLADLLVDAWVAAPVQASDLNGMLVALMGRVQAAGHLDSDRAAGLAADLADGSHGEFSRIGAEVVAVLGTLESLAGTSVGVAVAETDFVVPARGDADEPGTARAVVLVLTPGRLATVRQQILPAVARVLRDPSRSARLLQARSAEDVRAVRALMEAEFQEHHLVADAVTPVGYRVYPDTPLPEVLDLMVRRGIHAVPVVGEQYEVLGILTSGDALQHLVRRGRPGEGETAQEEGRAPTLARDVMTRTVLCVSEDQSLLDAAHMMVNRDVEQLPVVREGELVGFVTRDAILKALFGAPSPEAAEQADEPKESESTP